MTDATAQDAPEWTSFETHPDRYRHWKFRIEGRVAYMDLNVQEEEPEEGGDYLLKQNSYDLSVDIELSDCLQRLRFEHPEVRALVFGSALPRVFCAGANIYMLGASSHAFKVNFCKFTNETRLGLEDLSRGSGLTSIAALNGTAAGGGYELALACDEIYLVDDGNSAVSFPEVPLLGVLPGTGGLTRLVDKRKVRRDLADVFSTTAEGVKGKRAVEWNLVDGVFPRSKWDDKVGARVQEVLDAASTPDFEGVKLEALEPDCDENGISYRHVTLRWDDEARTAELEVRGPAADAAKTPADWQAEGSSSWAIRAFRELDDALLHLRMDLPQIGTVLLKTTGDQAAMLALDAALEEHKANGLVNETRLLMARVLRRLDLTAKSFFAMIEPESCFAGTLCELALAADRTYMLIDDDDENRIALSVMNGGAFPMTHGKSRLENRFYGTPERVGEVLERAGEAIDAEEAEELGLVTMALDDLDFEDETRLAIEERASLSPDALTGMEASLRFPGAEGHDTKIFGRLSAWQNWIFQRPNAVGEKGALSLYGKPTRPEFDFRRT